MMNIKETCKDLLRPGYRRFLAYINKGDNVTCNICGKSFRRLRPVLGRHADGTTYVIEDHVGSCWYCNSYPRTRQLYYWLTNDFKIDRKGHLKVLHVAPELQIADKLRKITNIDYTCIDKHCFGYKYPDYVADGDVCNLKFEDATFDVVICNHVLEHIIDDKTAMREIYRVLKNDGVAILMVPMDTNMANSIEEQEGENLSAAEREKRFGQYDHVRIYGLDYFQRLHDVGFNVNRVTYNNNIVSSYGMMPKEELVICSKN